MGCGGSKEKPSGAVEQLSSAHTRNTSDGTHHFEKLSSDAVSLSKSHSTFGLDETERSGGVGTIGDENVIPIVKEQTLSLDLAQGSTVTTDEPASNVVQHQRKESPPPARMVTSTTLRDPRARTKKTPSPSHTLVPTDVRAEEMNLVVMTIDNESTEQQAAENQMLETAAALVLAAAEARVEADRQTKQSAASVCSARAEAQGLQDFLSDSQPPLQPKYNLPEVSEQSWWSLHRNQ